MTGIDKGRAKSACSRETRYRVYVAVSSITDMQTHTQTHRMTTITLRRMRRGWYRVTIRKSQVKPRIVE